MRVQIELRGLVWLFTTLPAVALFLADRGEVERAVEVYAAASAHPYVSGSRWFEDVAGRRIATLAEGLPPGVAEAARERGAARDIWAVAEELLAELEGAAA